MKNNNLLWLLQKLFALYKVTMGVELVFYLLQMVFLKTTFRVAESHDK